MPPTIADGGVLPLPSHHDPFESLLVACLSRPREEWEAALEEACGAHPDAAEELRRRMRHVQAVERGLAGEVGAPRTLGEYELIERIGGGGMGVVYRARQRSLARDVALKLIRPELTFFEGSRERFRRETEAIARLAHPGIVSIHAVGEEGGLPYFAMELLPGATLSEVLSRVAGRAPETLAGRDLWEATLVPGRAAPECPEIFRGGWPEACLALAAQVARALEHAHARGFLHRDVKPSNVMVSADGRAVLLDFGLSSTADGARVTRTGTLVGTLVYMSVEQLEGRRELDARADVYSLGVTLYELLTLQAPFDADGEVRLRELILAGRADPVRARNRRVSTEAQTVCAEAMACSPSDRYPSAAALARDLEAVLARRPIAARPPGPFRRGLRLVRRRPFESAAAALALVAALGIPSGMAWVERRNARTIARSLASERSARAEADAARTRVTAALASEREARLQAQEQGAAAERARDAAVRANDTQQDVVHFLVDVLRGSWAGYHEGREPSIEEMLAFAGRSAESYLGDRPHSRARVEMTLGLVHNARAEHDLAAAHLERALDLLEPLASAGDVAAQRDLARTLATSGRARLHSGDRVRAEGELRRALELAEQALDPEDAQLYGYYNELAELFQYLGRHAECIEVRRRALEYVVENRPGDALLLAKGRAALGFSLFFAGRKLEGEPLLEEGLAGLRQHAPASDKELVQTLLRSAKVPASKGDFATAEQRLQEGLRLARDLWGESGDAVLGAEFELVDLQLKQGRIARAVEDYGPLLERAAAALAPEDAALVVGRVNYVTALYRLGRHGEVVAFHAATDLLRHAAACWGPDSPSLVRPLQELADSHLALGQVAEGVRVLDELIDVLEEVPGGREDLLVQLYTSHGLRRFELGDFTGAREALERMVELAGDGPVVLPLPFSDGPVEVGVQALSELVALGTERGWREDVERWRSARDQRRARVAGD